MCRAGASTQAYGLRSQQLSCLMKTTAGLDMLQLTKVEGPDGAQLRRKAEQEVV